MSTPDADEPPQTSARRRQTRERLMDAAHQVLGTQGIDETSIEAVCEAAGFTRGAFYSNFESKTELFLALTEREQRRRLAQVEAAASAVVTDLATPGRPFDVGRIGDVITALLVGLPDDRRWRLISTELEALALRQPEQAARLLAFEDQLFQELSAVIERLARSLGLRLLLPSLDMTRLLVAGYDRSSRRAYLSGAENHQAATLELVNRWLPTLAQRLTEPIDD